MLTAEPTPPAVIEELQNLVSRLSCLRENFDTLTNDFGIQLPELDDMPPIVDSHPDTPGLDGLRTEITRINTQIALIEQLHERLFAARSQLFGFGDGRWQTTTDAKPPVGFPDNYGPVRKGDFRAP